jgi:hypothetical protein
VPKTFRLKLHTTRNLADPEVSAALWRALDNPLIEPTKFDSVERAKHEFDAGAAEAAGKLYSREGMLFVRGAKDNFTAMFMRTADALSEWTFWWDVRAMSGKKQEPWLTWIFDLCGALPPHFASACSTAEHDAKHVVVEPARGGGSVTSQPGVSIKEFHKFLPGIYWLTIFGPEAYAHFGPDLESLPGTTSVKLASDLVAVILDEPVVPQDMDQRLRTESELADRLGAKYFFDRGRMKAKLTPVPGLPEALRRHKASS